MIIQVFFCIFVKNKIMRELDMESIEALERLRTDITNQAAKELQKILLQYYPIGTEIVVTKDYWIVKELRNDFDNIMSIKDRLQA